MVRQDEEGKRSPAWEHYIVKEDNAQCKYCVLKYSVNVVPAEKSAPNSCSESRKWNTVLQQTVISLLARRVSACRGNNSEALLYGGKGHDKRGRRWRILWATELHWTKLLTAFKRYDY